MSRTTNARIAGFTFLFYIAIGISIMVLSGRASSGGNIPERLATIAQHTTEMRVVFLLSVLTCLSALVLAVTLYSITREQDADLAMLALVCRVGEGLVSISVPTTLALVWLATSSGTNALDPTAAHALAALLFKLGGWKSLTSATLFAVGSALVSWLLLRGRMIPTVLAWLGFVASILLVVCLPLQLAGFLRGTFTQLMWLPMAAFEIPLGIWLMVKGVTAPARNQFAVGD